MYNYEEKWNLSREDVIKLFPVEKINKICGRNITFNVLFDDDILLKDTSGYNLSVFTRVFNEDIPDERLCRANLHLIYPLMESKSLREVVGIKLPQTMIYDDLGYDEYMMGLHFTKLRSDEYYINDFVMRKNPNSLLHNGIAKEVIKNLISLAKSNNIRYISGYAMNEKVFKIFISYGFEPDIRPEYGNDWLMNIAKQTKGQYPFFIDLSK